MIHSTWIATYVRDVHPDFFTSYKIEADKFNGKPHYTSTDGQYALAYASDCDYWDELYRDRRQDVAQEMEGN